MSALRVTGTIVKATRRQVQSKRGQFTVYRYYVINDDNDNSAPLEVKSTVEHRPGEELDIPVYFRLWTSKKTGAPGVDLVEAKPQGGR